MENIGWLDERSSGEYWMTTDERSSGEYWMATDERSSWEYLNISKFPDISCRKGNNPAYEDMKLGKYRNKVKIFTMILREIFQQIFSIISNLGDFSNFLILVNYKSIEDLWKEFRKMKTKDIFGELKVREIKVL